MRKIRTIFVFSMLSFSLSGCTALPTMPSTLSGALHTLTHSGAQMLSGATKTIQDTVDLGKLELKKAGDTVQDVQNRANKVGEGVNKMKEGIDLVKDATK